MIARIWRATATPDNAPHYAEHFENSVLPELRQTLGFVDAYLLQRDAGEQREIIAFTLWESLDVIRNFAGEDIERAVVAPAAQAVLSSFDDTVTHYEITHQANI
jgi:heme-degrading monooxygenase HmoA